MGLQASVTLHQAEQHKVGPGRWWPGDEGTGSASVCHLLKQPHPSCCPQLRLALLGTWDSGTGAGATEWNDWLAASVRILNNILAILVHKQ